MRHLLFFAAVVLAGCMAEHPRAPASTATGLRFLGGDADPGFARALAPRQLVFPEDHGAHPEYQTEWWYFTGNVASETGRHFGFELTFFRYALAPPKSEQSSSAWRSRQVWMAHFAITDTAEGRFWAAERRSREALKLAGASDEPLRVWVNDWSLEDAGAARGLALRLNAQDGTLGLALELESSQAPIANGEGGLSRKGSASGNASYYYSVPRLATRGTLKVGGAIFQVSGLAWMDREWSTSSLERGVTGWDWLALNLSDGASFMFYRLRTDAGGSSPLSGGTWVGSDGAIHALAANDVALTALDHWRSPATGSRYPIVWRLRVPSEEIDVEIRPYLENQEIDLSVRYWEGAVRAEGFGRSGQLTGQGYLELAGY